MKSCPPNRRPTRTPGTRSATAASAWPAALIVFGCTDDPNAALRIAVPAGDYAARVSHGGLDTLSEDGLDGDDRYRIQLWPGPVRPVTVVKGPA